MSRIFGFVSVVAIVVTAACNGGGDNNAAVSNEQRNEAVANVASGQGTPVDVKAVMRARHEHYEEMGKAMKGITTQLKAGSPDVAAIQGHAALIARYGPQLLTWFPEGSGPEAGKTRAKAEIWQDMEAFRSIGGRFEQESAAFHRAAQGGDIAAIRAALPALGKTCSDCHKRFRGPDEH
ncbi:c-type cytochrome [Allosphingosinicella sp.]|jgi:cytochrome c556|uniref:c-type cytochrome n=1 Tax=Allosphingosinicella sp. TaxID=2823234 RepID=UPI002EFDFD7A